MHIKNLNYRIYNYDMRNIILRFHCYRKIMLIVFSMLLIYFITITYNRMDLHNSSYKYTSTSDFRFDVNKLTEVTKIAEIKRISNRDDGIYFYGSDGKTMQLDDIKPSLRNALIKIEDSNEDGKISEEEISGLGLMRLEPDVINKELKEFQYHLDLQDNNLKNYVIITKGNNLGTVLYNGNLKFVDNEGRRYFGIELFN